MIQRNPRMQFGCGKKKKKGRTAAYFYAFVQASFKKMVAFAQPPTTKEIESFPRGPRATALQPHTHPSESQFSDAQI